MNSKLVRHPKLGKAEAELHSARTQIYKITPTSGDPDPTTIAITHLATALEALTAVLLDLDAKQ
ncbi:MAG TPA: hypothetical protein VIO38_11735 [Rariglobus sp.]